MRRRDFHLVVTLWISLVLNVGAVSALSFMAVRRLRSFRSDIDSFASRLDSAERTVADACGAALAAAESIGNVPLVDSEGVPLDTPQVLGYGQTKTTKSILIYRDVRHSSGEVQREYLSKIPIFEKTPTDFLKRDKVFSSKSLEI